VLPVSAMGSYFIVETNVPTITVQATSDDEILAQLTQQIAGVADRVQQTVGKPLDQVGTSDLAKLGQSDFNFMLYRTPIGASPARDWDGPFTTNNELAAAATILNQPPDLVVTLVSAPSTANSGDIVNVTYTVTNQSDFPVWAGTHSWTDYVVVSPDAAM